MDLKNLNSKENWNVVVTDYQDFRKVVVAFIKYGKPKMTDNEVEKCIKRVGEGLIHAKFNMNKKDYAEGKYVFNDAAAISTNYE